MFAHAFRRAATGLAACVAVAATCRAGVPVRIKDVARLEGVRANQLHGIGLVVGLSGTGDSGLPAKQFVANMLERYHVTVSTGDLAAKNVAAVVVTADTPPFVRVGSRLDVVVSSVGDAKSLQGGTLLQTPLRAANGQVYAAAQGAVSIGGFSAEGEAANLRKNFPTVGRVPGGAIVERKISMLLPSTERLTWILSTPDFTTAVRMARAINDAFPEAACPGDAATVSVTVPRTHRGDGDLPRFVATLEEIQFVPDTRARVVVNERTGTIVAGEHVKVCTVAVCHGNLTIHIRETETTSQPAPFSGGETATEKSTDITAQEEKAGLTVLNEGANISDVAKALNLLRVSPRDMISIFQALKMAGALQAELILM